jgi:hypothetical protein
MVVVPNDILCFKLTIIDGMGRGKEVDNEDIMPEEATNTVLVWDGIKLCIVGFLSRKIVAIERDKAGYIGRFA